MRRKIYSGSAFEEIAGYARAVIDEDWVFVSGTTGYDYKTGDISDDPIEQARRCFQNISDALERAGSSLADVVRVVIYIADRSDFDSIARVVGDHLRDIRPANTTVIAQLVKPEMKVEIEVTARRQTGGA
jgi:enamine deaminase RidA (YjgF/YER057c/UK114 family)